VDSRYTCLIYSWLYLYCGFLRQTAASAAKNQITWSSMKPELRDLPDLNRFDLFLVGLFVCSTDLQLQVLKHCFPFQSTAQAHLRMTDSLVTDYSV